MTGMNAAAAIQLAWQQLQAGQLAQAESICRQILSQNPQSAEALQLLGIIAMQCGNGEAAIELIGRAISLQPNYFSAHDNLGIVLANLGRIDQAIASHQRAIQIHPGFAEGHCHLGNCYWQKRQLGEAGASFRRAIQLNPKFADPYVGLSNVLKETGQLDESIAACRMAILLNPNFAGAYRNLGNVLHLRGTDQLDQVIAAYQRALQLHPNDANTHCDLGNALADQHRYDEAIASYQRSIQLNPAHAPAFGYLGSALTGQGRLDEAIEACRTGIRMQPTFSWMRGNLLYAMYHHPSFNAEQLLEETRDWARNCAPVMATGSIARDPSPTRRLKIGYLSPFFFRCADAHYIVPLLAHHDAEQFEIFCYSRIAAASVERSLFRFDQYHDITRSGPQGAADLIRRHEIDILVSMCRPADEFLRVLTYRPAPVQMTWMTFASATTGMEVVDYRISDPFIDPIGSEEGCYAEKTLRLQETAWCYDPMLEAPPVGPMPALTTGHVTFGALNRWCKINPMVQSAWADVMRSVPNSRLLILALPGSHRQRAMDDFEKLGVDPSRIEFIARTSPAAYLDLYNRIDLTLDTFPFSGHTTALDSLWMGVPVITLSGRTCVGRAAASALHNVGLTDWIAKTPQEYVSIATGAAQDLPKLAHLRGGLRQKMQSSALSDGPRFARQMERLYRQAWAQSQNMPS